MRTLLLTAIYLFVVSLAACSDGTQSIKVGVLTTLENSGLLAHWVTRFKHQYPALRIKPVVAGSGHIHTLLKNGDIQTAISHSPHYEQALLQNNVIATRTPFLQNHFIVVAPESDPAQVQQATTTSEAFKSIAQSQARFVSRGDNSGTDYMERYWWQQSKQHPYPVTHLKTGTGMGATLTVIAEYDAYTLVNKGTWLQFGNPQRLSALFESPTKLRNTYSILSTRHHTKGVNLWEQWLLDIGINISTAYRIQQQPVFYRIHAF